MNKKLIYVPIFRVRQEENKVLHSFDFGNRIYPCVEIVKEFDRKQRETSSMDSSSSSRKKNFEDIYIPFIEKINSEKIFVDLPVHLQPKSRMKPEVLIFLRGVISSMNIRNDYMLRLGELKEKIIPVISSYFQISGQSNTLESQAQKLRKVFPVLAIRTFPERFFSDLDQVKSILTKRDFLIIDFDHSVIDEDDSEIIEIIDELKDLKCNIIVHRSAIPKDLRNVDLEHAKIIGNCDNSLLRKYKLISGASFSDYCGIKKDDITIGGSVSPGFVYFDAVKNLYYGFKGIYNEPQTYDSIIIPDVFSSIATKRMISHSPNYLTNENKGWEILNAIRDGNKKGRYAPIYKRISMEHYLYCMRTKINNGDFD